jgi:hypothetical protein
VSFALTPIGRVRGGRAEPVDDAWDAVEAEIVLDPAELGPDAALGLDAFSHIGSGFPALSRICYSGSVVPE